MCCNRNSQKNVTDKILITKPVSLLHVGASAQNNLTVKNVLKPYIEKRQFQVIIIATNEEWKIMQEKARPFTDLFQVMRTQSADYVTAFKIAISHRRYLESQNNCTFTIPAINTIFDHYRNFLQHKALPGGVISIMSQFAARYKGRQIDVNNIRTELKILSGLQPGFFDNAFALPDQEIVKYIENELIGQPQAVVAIADVAHIIRARMQVPGKPIASLLFTGPTGVGKTHAAKVLCQLLTGSVDKLLRFDMNEYVDASAVSRLIGDAWRAGGQLTSQVRLRPFAVILYWTRLKKHILQCTICSFRYSMTGDSQTVQAKRRISPIR